MHDLLIVSVGVLAPLLIGLAITVESPRPDPVLVFGALFGVAIVVLLLRSTRYTVTLTLLAVYLGLLDGPIKLEASGRGSSALRDVLIIALVVGMVMRLLQRKEPVRMPPLSGWVVAFVAVVLVNALNPHTDGLLKTLGGYRQQLEWVPFFFFGYLIVNSKLRFRQLFLILGVLALANGVVGTVQSRLSPAQLASWGPGYRELANGGEGNGITGRTYSVEGVARVRPPALGSDAGFGGGVGTLALPGLLALLAIGHLRRRWPVVLLSIGAVLGVATAASRTAIIASLASLVIYALLSLFAGLRVSRPLVGLLVMAVLAFAVGSVLISSEGSAIFARQETLTSVQSAQESGGGGKERALSEIPRYLEAAPFGFGLGIAGSASGFGGRNHPELEGQKVMGGSAYSLLVKELGLPGLLLWLGLTINVILLAVRGLRRVVDVELRTYLVALLAGFIGLTIQGFSGPTLAVTEGAFLWFVPGVMAYWFAGPGWAAASARIGRATTATTPVSAL